MKLIKNNRECSFVALDHTKPKQTRRGKGGATFVKVQFGPTKEEAATAERLGRRPNFQIAWVNASNLAEHGGL
jgi:hypothetical protein